MFKVYHTKNWELNTMLHFETDSYEPKKEDYKLVAIVDCEEFGDTFRLTNHIDTEWWNNKEVECIGEETHRSTSVGDLVEDEDGNLHLCASIGWEKVNWKGEKQWM